MHWLLASGALFLSATVAAAGDPLFDAVSAGDALAVEAVPYLVVPMSTAALATSQRHLSMQLLANQIAIVSSY